VQGVSRADRELWDAERVVGDLVPSGSVFAFLAGHRREVFDDAFTADLFPSATGRPSLPADLVGSVLVLKELYDLSDRQTAEAVMFDLRWKVACGLSLTATAFDPTTLVYWRKRIAASQRPDRVFEAVAQVIAETGILVGRRKRCVDSTVLDDAVATQDTVTQVVAAIRRVARAVPGAGAVVARVCMLDYTRAGKPDIDWDDPDAKAGLVSALVTDALAVLAALCGPDAPERDDAAAQALGLLALVAGQDVEPAEDCEGTEGRWRIARKVAPDRVISLVDPQARHTRKSRSQRRDGFRAHLAAEPDTGLITDCELTMATGADATDAAMGVTLANRDRFGPDTTPDTDTDTEAVVDTDTDTDTVPDTDADDGHDDGHDDGPSGNGPNGLEIYGDSAYGSGAARAGYASAGHDTVIKPKPVTPAVPGGFSVDDFAVDEQAKTVTCPGGHTRPITKSRTVTFGRLCSDCPLRARCTTAKTGRSMTIHEHEALLRAARAQGRTAEFKAAYPTRANVERTIAHVATQNGRRVKLRYRGVDKNNAWLRTRAAALNLRTLLRHGLTPVNGTWTLATA
jgi:Transposase DDE domain/Transposase domain (DUF772)